MFKIGDKVTGTTVDFNNKENTYTGTIVSVHAGYSIRIDMGNWSYEKVISMASTRKAN